MNELMEVGQNTYPAIVRRSLRLGKSQSEIVQRIMATSVQHELTDELKGFKSLLNSKGLTDSRGDAIYAAVQRQIYSALGLSEAQKKALKGDSHYPLLDFFTEHQLLAVNEAKLRLIRIYRNDMRAGVLRDVTNAAVRETLKAVGAYYRGVFGV